MTTLRAIFISAVAMLPSAAEAANADHGAQPAAPTSRQSNPQAPVAGPNPADQSQNPLVSDIIVTARRRSESLQTTPVSISAFNSDDLYRRSITRASDLQTVTPGLMVASGGFKTNVTLSMRGQRRSTIGQGAPTVLVYENEVPLPVLGSLIPTFDVSSVQVLKGPQGTLFGRNATAGAILIYSAAPTYDIGGYADLRFGNYDNREVEGAINVPIIRDKVALRVAGQLARRDGYTKNLGAGPDLDDRHDESVRVSLLVQPIDRLKNIIVYERYHADEHGGSLLLYGLYPNITAGGGALRLPALARFFDCGTGVNCDADLQLARQKAIGPRQTYTDIPSFSRLTLESVSNTTTLDLGDALTLKNIFGYRSVDFRNLVDIDGTPLRLLDSRQINRTRQITDEIQASGKLADGKLDWIVGGFYLDDRPHGAITFATAVLSPGTALPTNQQTYTYSSSKALYGQIGYDLSALVTGLKIDLGIRHTWDKVAVCNVSVPGGGMLLTAEQCATLGQTIRGNYDATTWTAGLNWQVSRDLFLYATSRHGYRSGGINTPLLGAALASVQTYKPETITDVEIGVKANGRIAAMPFRLSIAGYRGWYDGLQRNYTPPPNFDRDGNSANDPVAGVVVNAGKAILQGVESEAHLRPASGLDLGVTGAYTDAHYRSLTLPAVLAAANLIPANAVNNKFPFVPAWTYGVQADYTLPIEGLGNLLLHGDFYHSDRFWVNDRPAADVAAFAPGYDVVNARLGLLDIRDSGLDISVFANNIFDKTYVAGTGNFAPGLGFVTVNYGPPRLYGVELRKKF